MSPLVLIVSVSPTLVPTGKVIFTSTSPLISLGYNLPSLFASSVITTVGAAKRPVFILITTGPASALLPAPSVDSTVIL